MREPNLKPSLVAELRLRPLGWSASRHLVRGQAPVGGGRRGAIVGWGADAARANQAFLQSVDYAAMPKGGHSVTLTMRRLPSPAQWWLTRRRLAWWLTKRGASAHWVVEWQRRGVPHLHLAVWGVSGAEVVDWWLAHTDGGRSGQHARRIRTPAIWAHYCAKHGARGLGHYQRNRASLVGAWATQSAGRLWGRMGKAWAGAVCAEEVWTFAGGEADYLRVAARMRAATGGGESDYLRGCGAWGNHLLAMDGMVFVKAGSDPPATQTGEVLERRCFERLQRIRRAGE